MRSLYTADTEGLLSFSGNSILNVRRSFNKMSINNIDLLCSKIQTKCSQGMPVDHVPLRVEQVREKTGRYNFYTSRHLRKLLSFATKLEKFMCAITSNSNLKCFSRRVTCVQKNL